MMTLIKLSANTFIFNFFLKYYIRNINLLLNIRSVSRISLINLVLIYHQINILFGGLKLLTQKLVLQQ